jgi:hypothetical protein
MTWRPATSTLVILLTSIACSPATGGLGSGGGDGTDGSETADTSTGSSGNEGSEAEGNSGDGDGDSGDGDGDSGDGDPGDGDGDSGDGDGDGDAGGVCGDGVADANEDCDGSDLAGSDCVALGFIGGELECDVSCVFNTKGCTMELCGNGVVDVGEECDGVALGGADCIALGEGPGVPSCTVDCKLDLSTCGIPGEGEPCDWGGCPDNLYCEDNTCYDGSLGDPCESDNQCLNGTCEGEWGDNHCE